MADRHLLNYLIVFQLLFCFWERTIVHSELLQKINIFKTVQQPLTDDAHIYVSLYL